VTPTRALLRARDLLVRANAPIVGVLVNAVHAKSTDYHQYYGVRNASKTIAKYYNNALIG
jgi:Mrp family chromosome partitioning ATPase